VTIIPSKSKLFVASTKAATKGLSAVGAFFEKSEVRMWIDNRGGSSTLNIMPH
jgi:hypothetical protein